MRGIKRSKELSLFQRNHTTLLRGRALVALTVQGESSVVEHPGNGCESRQRAAPQPMVHISFRCPFKLNTGVFSYERSRALHDTGLLFPTPAPSPFPLQNEIL